MNKITRHLLRLLPIMVAYICLSVVVRNLFELDVDFFHNPGFLLLDSLTYLAGIASGIWSVGLTLLLEEQWTRKS